MFLFLSIFCFAGVNPLCLDGYRDTYVSKKKELFSKMRRRKNVNAKKMNRFMRKKCMRNTNNKSDLTQRELPQKKIERKKINRLY